MKKCNNCGDSKPINDFYRNSNSPDGRINQCKLCVKSRVSSRYYKMKSGDYSPNKRGVPKGTKEIPGKEHILNSIYCLIMGGSKVTDACNKNDVSTTWYYKHRVFASNSRYEKMKKRAEIVEYVIGLKKSIKETSVKLDVSESLVKSSLSAYFGKPKENLTLKSKV